MREWFENKTVALVGNAQSLLLAPRGDDIDVAGVVVRLNRGILAPTINKLHVAAGKRTDVWMFNLYTRLMQHTLGKVHNVNFAKMQMNEDTNRKNFECSYPSVMLEKLTKITYPVNPTTGLRAIDYILSCGPTKLNVYGFDWKSTPTFYMPNADDSLHDYKKEKKYCEDLAKKFDELSFYK